LSKYFFLLQTFQQINEMQIKLNKERQKLCLFNIIFRKVFKSKQKLNILILKYRIKGRYTLDILARDIAIKRDEIKIKLILSHGCLKVNQGKLLVPWFWFVKSLPWPIEIDGSELSFYRNIFLSQYCASKCLVCISPYVDQHLYGKICFVCLYLCSI